MVLIGANMPSILSEISFISNPGDEKLLRKQDQRQHVADGLYRGIASYLESMNSLSYDKSKLVSRCSGALGGGHDGCGVRGEPKVKYRRLIPMRMCKPFLRQLAAFVVFSSLLAVSQVCAQTAARVLPLELRRARGHAHWRAGAIDGRVGERAGW